MILVVGEQIAGRLSASTYHLLAAAQQLPGEIVVLLGGEAADQAVEALEVLPAVKQVWLAKAASNQPAMAEIWTALLLQVMQEADFSHVLMPANSFGKEVMPRVAAKRDQGMLSDVIAIESADCFVRPIYAGNAWATVKSLDSCHLLTIRCSSFTPCEKGAGHELQVRSLEFLPEAASAQFVSHCGGQSERPSLSEARVVVSGGRALRDKETFALLEKIADQLGAAVGASRAAVDAGLVPNEYQVGQTGQIVAPELYIAIGISGAIQHLAGMSSSKVIVAINKDEDAPIFQVADYGLVGDLFEILPELHEQLACASQV